MNAIGLPPSTRCLCLTKHEWYRNNTATFHQRSLPNMYVYMCTCWKVGTSTYVHTCVHVSCVKCKVYGKWLVKHRCCERTAVLKMKAITLTNLTEINNIVKRKFIKFDIRKEVCVLNVYFFIVWFLFVIRQCLVEKQLLSNKLGAIWISEFNMCSLCLTKSKWHDGNVDNLLLYCPGLKSSECSLKRCGTSLTLLIFCLFLSFNNRIDVSWVQSNQAGMSS